MGRQGFVGRELSPYEAGKTVVAALHSVMMRTVLRHRDCIHYVQHVQGSGVRLPSAATGGLFCYS
jgi:hypothetical protein